MKTLVYIVTPNYYIVFLFSKVSFSSLFWIQQRVLLQSKGRRFTVIILLLLVSDQVFLLTICISLLSSSIRLYTDDTFKYLLSPFHFIFVYLQLFILAMEDIMFVTSIKLRIEDIMFIIKGIDKFFINR